MDIVFKFCFVIGLCLCVVLPEIDSSECYKKFKVTRSGKTLCRKPLKNLYSNIKACCTSERGVAFALSKVKIGRFYRCKECSSLGLGFVNKKKPTFKRIKTKKPYLPIRKNTNKPESGWGSWSTCSSSCGGGWRRRFRKCKNCPKWDAVNYRIEPCITNAYCPVDGSWGPWDPWKICNTTCGGGVQERYRHCNYPVPSHGGKFCPGSGVKRRTCNTHKCSDVDTKRQPTWTVWSEYSACSDTCGDAVQTRYRTCFTSGVQKPDRFCTGNSSETISCFRQPCRVAGTWSRWSRWGPCAVTCGEGSRSRKRQCSHLGNCRGKEVDYQLCYVACSLNSYEDTPTNQRQSQLHPRPTHATISSRGPVGSFIQPSTTPTDKRIHGGWTPWAVFTPCTSIACSRKVGILIRSRTCTKPSPSNGGDSCFGSMYSTVKCVNDSGCPVNGEWCPWTEWSPCQVTCVKSGTKKSQFIRGRRRQCSCPATKHGGIPCSNNLAPDGIESQIEECSHLPMCEQSTRTNVPIVALPELSHSEGGSSSNTSSFTTGGNSTDDNHEFSNK